MEVLILVGSTKLHTPAYRARDWWERDNFDTLEQAKGYARSLHSRFPVTPYRIVLKGKRYVVQFVPAHLLKKEPA